MYKFVIAAINAEISTLRQIFSPVRCVLTLSLFNSLTLNGLSSFLARFHPVFVYISFYVYSFWSIFTSGDKHIRLLAFKQTKKKTHSRIWVMVCESRF